ncbi:LutB/LldF family L-lactate oxidation iron-sulfur protein [Telmatospirillum sp. J64-1]|uniref:LutB/LldF family L-lactate oxidation iron-sulfur protein n=1 Tax=Telmatospirillum sp. J64-1 TaxID=2502183 RepID=UPI00115F5B3F|nr:LutB/LldF family L-lactate oxidation iron-sulfur protein [Telmatospirillum sp. J64-1]
MGNFGPAAREALKDGQLRSNFRRAMDGLMSKRAALFADQDEWTRLRALGESIKARALAQLPELLEKLEANCRKNGIQVHWAETTAQANDIILGLLQKRGAKTLVKGKSMVSEEMHLNAFLEGHGIEALETDLGEYVIQLDHEAPSHIIMPAIHKNKQQIARLFSEKIKEAQYTEDVDALTGMARQVLRRKFREADAGLSGVNFAVAETGTLCLVENEGNGRLCTTVPPLHIAVMGLEKVVERLEDVPPLISLLTRSATGQPITTYVNMITSPRRPGEKDGPEEVHLVILDNGRSRSYSDEQLRRTLQCIRCGACMNHCPVYTRVGGHAYNAPYPGPIGKILMPQIEGMEAKGELAHASSLCNACVEVCPVKIPIAELLVRLRTEGAHARADAPVLQPGAERSTAEALAWKMWSRMATSPTAWKMAGTMAGTFDPLMPEAFGPLADWKKGGRTRPRFAKKSLHRLLRDKGVPDA